MSEIPQKPDNTNEESREAIRAECSRREFVRTGSRLLIYSAPLIQLFHTKEALAGSGATGSAGKKAPVKDLMGTIDMVKDTQQGPFGTLKTY